MKKLFASVLWMANQAMHQQRRLKRSAFTLLELLISIALLSMVLLALYQSLTLLRSSNTQLFEYLVKANNEKKITETLFKDIAGSDGNITIEGHEFTRLCIEDTVNSLYELSSAKVCWLVTKKDNRLIRSEGNNYNLPLNHEDRIAVDTLLKDISLFRVYKKKGEVLVLLQEKGKESISFMVHGVADNTKKKNQKPTKVKIKRNPNARTL